MGGGGVVGGGQCSKLYVYNVFCLFCQRVEGEGKGVIVSLTD